MKAEFVVSSISVVGTKEKIHLTPKVTNADNGDTIMYDSWTDLVKAGWVLEGTL
jgi:hypothetical protein